MAANKTQSKSDFIRSQPSTLSAAEVVAKAKAEGIKIDPALVYKVRGRTGAKRKAKKISTAKPTAATGSKKPQSKAAFIRSLREDMPVKEVIAAAKEKGIKIADTYVYRTRRSAKKKVTKAAARRATTARTGAAVPRPSASTSSAETLLKAVAAEIGLGRAMEILAGERARVRALIMG